MGRWAERRALRPEYRGGSARFVSARRRRSARPLSRSQGRAGLFGLSPQRRPRTGRQASAPAWCAGLRPPRREYPLTVSTPGRTAARLRRGRDPARPHHTAAEGLDPGALPMRWGEESLGVVSAAGITRSLSTSLTVIPSLVPGTQKRRRRRAVVASRARYSRTAGVSGSSGQTRG